MTTTDLITYDEAAELAGVSTRTIRNWVAEGHLTRYSSRTGPGRAFSSPRVERRELGRFLRYTRDK